MKNLLLTIIFFLSRLIAFGQIDVADSTVQVITYWDKGDKQTYKVKTEKIKIKGADTTSRELISYDVEITVLNSDEESYTVEWLYKNIYTDNQNPTVQKIINITKDMRVIFKTNEFGVFIEVINWEEVRDYIQKAAGTLEKDFKDIPEIDKILKQIQATYSTKEAIEAASIKDIHQFYTFHGAKYKLVEVLQGELKVPNLLGKEPFDAEITVYLDEINQEKKNFIMRATQKINREQLINATLTYMETMAKNMKVEPPTREDVKDLKNETLTASRVHVSGWVIYSIQTTTVTSGNVQSIEERIIEIQ